MAEMVTNELMFGVLKQIQGSLGVLKDDMTDVKGQLIRVREDINHLSANELRMERMIAEVNVRLDRVER